MLSDLLEKVKDEHLSLEQCEKLRDSLIHIKTDVYSQLAEHKKKRALFIASSEGSVATRKMHFDATPEGQRLFELQGILGGLQGEIDALQSRIYGHLRLNG